MTPALSVVIPVLNGVETIELQIRALLRQTASIPFEIVVADNGSTDGTQGILDTLCDPRLRVIDAAGAPLGGGAAKNMGVVASRASFVAFTDADDEVAPGWVDAAYAGLLQSQCVVFAREYRKLNPKLPASLTELRGAPAFRGVPVISGGAFGIHRDLYLDVGGFKSMAGAVDTEFGLRLYRRTGTAPTYVPDAVVHVRLPSGVTPMMRREVALSATIPDLVSAYTDLLQTSGHPAASTLFVWLRLITLVPKLLSRQDRHAYLLRVARQYGLLKGWRRTGVLIP